MSLSLALAIYFILWWVVLFAVLPLRIGVQPRAGESDPFADAAGAPHAPHLPIKFLITTLVSAVLFGVIYAVVAFDLVRLDDMPFLKI